MIPPRPRDDVELTTRDLQVLSQPPNGIEPDVIVSVSVHGDNRDLSRCLRSVEQQDLDLDRLGVAVLLDEVVPNGDLPEVPDRLAGRTWVLSANCGSAARARNATLEFADLRIPSCKWIARLDWDDRFADPKSLSETVRVGEGKSALFVLGGNRVLAAEDVVTRHNPANRELLLPQHVLGYLQQMAEGTAKNELPSCNLLLAARSGIRYPDTSSAEDHWLAADLLMHHGSRGEILETVLYADYTIDGSVTRSAKKESRYRAARVALYEAAQTWLAVADLPGRLLGLGQEGVVREHSGIVHKHFYPGILTSEKAQWLDDNLSAQSIVPRPRFAAAGHTDSWVASYPWEETEPATSIPPGAVNRFLAASLDARIVCANIKRSNFRLTKNGDLLYIDIGNWVVPMDVSILRDSAARLYSIGVLDNPDEEVLRRKADHSRPEIWDRLPGFALFYGHIISKRIHSDWRTGSMPPALVPPRRSDVSLLIKACAMDAAYLEEQVTHIVDQLTGPADFFERILLIDPHQGPFLRQHRSGDLDAVHRTAERLCREGIIDRVLTAPADSKSNETVCKAWFDLDCGTSHSIEGVPVTPQLWSFAQLHSRFVLQCDVDVLIGRRQRSHDYLSEMVSACQQPGVVGIAFNIPKDPDSIKADYAAPTGEFKPEVRCGLLDLERLLACRPLPNRVLDGRLALPWYRSLHEYQQLSGLRTLRGGDPATFYVHPSNDRKGDLQRLAIVRDQVSQGKVPQCQWGRWDLEGDEADWSYPSRSESLVVLARGRNTEAVKIMRFAGSLRMQTDQTFGVIVIDDASNQGRPSLLADSLSFLGPRLTLIRNPDAEGGC